MSVPVNAKGRLFSWSDTALADFEGCPARYAAARFYCTTPFVETEATIYGSRVHKAAEMFIQGRGPLDLEALAPVEPYCTAMLRSGCPIEAELEVALTRDMKPTRWFSKDAWLRAKLDVVLAKTKTHTVLYDWKTAGKIKEDEDQLRLCAAALSTTRPHIESIEGKYIWTKHKQVTGIKPLSRAEIPAVWEEFLHRVVRMEAAWASESFPARSSGLCNGWCPNDKCIYWRGKR